MTVRALSKGQILALLKESSDVFTFVSRRARILPTLGWGRAVAADFFRRKGTELPKPEYKIDRKVLTEALEALGTLHPKLVGDHPVLQWLMRTKESFTAGVRLLLAVESEPFFQISTELYGNSQSRLARGQTTNLELARSISGRISVCNLNDIGESNVLMSAQELQSGLEKRMKARTPPLPVRVELTEEIVA
jgi:hypothetical protein